MKSVWQETTILPTFPELNGEIHADVLVIGGGIAGILTAYFLHQVGMNYLLVEKEKICSGTTQNTTAKITCQHGLIYQKIVKNYGIETAQKYLSVNQKAFRKYTELCQNIDCDFEYQDNYVYSINDRHKLENEINVLQKIGCPVQFCEKLPMPFAVAGAVKFPDQAQFHPLKFISAIAGKLHIYENTFVRELCKNTAVTDKARIHADKIIIATHFPFLNKHGSYFLKLYQHRSYVLALEHAQDVHGMYVDEDHKGMSFRNHENLLLIGGGGHRTGKYGGSWTELRNFAKKYYPHAQEKYFWAAQDCMSLDNMPYIGEYSKNTPNLYVASGFNKWGITGAMVSAMLLCDRVLNRQNAFADIFSPSRTILRSQLFLNGVEAAKNLLTISEKRCPHLGCALKWNPEEHSWDCACHGSRFSETGTILDNPANRNLQI